jgi:O-antigen ligase
MGESQYFDKKNLRFGDYRLFFPNIEFAFFVYFMTLAELLNKRNIKRLLPKLGFVCLIAYIALATGTRVHLLTMTVVTLIAFVTGWRRSVKMAGIVLLTLCISVEALSLAINSEGISLFEENKFSKVIKFSMDTKESSIQGRVFQNRMYWNNFQKAPLAGVGTLRYTPRLDTNYRRYGFYWNNDLGYMKILAEYGIVGIVWVLWFYSYVFRKTKGVIAANRSTGEEGNRVFIAKGVQLYILYVAVSAITLPHFVEGARIIPIALAMVFIEAARRSRPEIAATPVLA